MKLQVNVSDEMVENIDKYAKQMGVSRSALCSMLIGQGIMGYNKGMELLSILGDKLGDNLESTILLKDIKDNEIK